MRDQSWFVERVNLDANRVNAAAELARVIVDPFLETKKVIQRSGEALSRQEAKTALFFLEMQVSDEQRGKGLTRSVFESLIKGVLRGTGSEDRITRDQLFDRVSQLLPQHSAPSLKPYIESALGRLIKSAVRHWPTDDTFCLTHQE